MQYVFTPATYVYETLLDTNTEAVSPTWIVPFVKIFVVVYCRLVFFYYIEVIEKYSVENVDSWLVNTTKKKRKGKSAYSGG